MRILHNGNIHDGTKSYPAVLTSDDGPYMTLQLLISLYEFLGVRIPTDSNYKEGDIMYPVHLLNYLRLRIKPPAVLTVPRAKLTFEVSEKTVMEAKIVTKLRNREFDGMPITSFPDMAEYIKNNRNDLLMKSRTHFKPYVNHDPSNVRIDQQMKVEAIMLLRNLSEYDHNTCIEALVSYFEIAAEDAEILLSGVVNEI